jgi:hypothetical protein
LLECEKSCPATASSTLTDEEIEAHNKRWDIKNYFTDEDMSEAYREGKKDGREEVECELRACEDEFATESEGEETEPEKWELKDLIPNEEVKCDDMGVAVQYNEETEGWDVLEPYCVECGKPESEVEVNYFTIENEVFICCECNENKEEDSVVYCFECKNPTTMCDCTDYSVEEHFKHTFYTLAKTDNGKKKAFIKHIKNLLNIKSSNRVDNIIWESDIETYDTLYFDTKKPDNRHIKVDYRDLDKNKHFPNQAYKNIDATYQIEFDVQYKKYSDNNNVWTYL